jgi:DNA gyrase subunit A
MPKKVDAIISAELTEVREKYADPRRTEIVDDGAEIDMRDLIEDEEMVVTVSHNGYIKRALVSEYREQRRGGKGIIGAAWMMGTSLRTSSSAPHLQTFLYSLALGGLYWLKVYEIPESGRTSRGRALVNLLEMKEDEKLCAILPIREWTQNSHVVIATKSGVIEKTALEEFSQVSP